MSVDVVPTKFCSNPNCSRHGERLPWTEFNVKVRWPDGSTRQPHSRCKVCQREITNAWHKRKREADPEWERARRARRLERLRNDPERWAADLARRRQWKRKKYGYKRVLSHYDRPAGHAGGRRLDPAPFGAWLSTLGDTPAEIALIVGLDKEQVRKYMNGKQRVVFDVVDRATLNAGTLTRADDLYRPEGD